ncbi:MAG TPA: ATP-binding protein, partial [Rhodospirillales bacterium]|nr:ATP-binding protein [Rhodospirillales bacterium]
ILEIRAGYPPEDRLDERDRAAAEWAWTQGVPTGRGSTTLPAASWLFLPMQTTRGMVGVLGVRAEGKDAPPTPEESRLLEALAGQAAMAIERTILVADVEAASVAAETDRLRTAVLSSLSKELKAPIGAIVAATDRLIATDAAGLPATERRAAAMSIQEEAEQLDHFMQNLVHMTRLDTGGLRPHPDWANLADIVGEALDRAKKLLHKRQLRVDIDPAVPPLRVDRVLLEQVFFNLIDNACKYSPPDSRIGIWARRHDDRLLIEISDEGPGIPAEDREKVFDMFYRGAAVGAAGGLGLAVCRGIVEAHDGRIRVEAGLHNVGASICIQLPLPEDEAAPVEEEAS